MGRRSLLAVVGWLATAAVATLIGLAAIQLVGEGLTGTPGGVRSQEEVARALAEAGPTGTGMPTTTPSPGPATATATPSPGVSAGAQRAFATPGGNAVAQCVPGGVWLATWSPAQGYRVEKVDRGPDDEAEVKFAGPSGEYELKVRCVGEQPVAEVEKDD